MIDLKLGSKGFLVKRLQNQLSITADGDFGPNTLKHVISFQKRYGLVINGVVGWKTWNLLLNKNARVAIATKFTTTPDYMPTEDNIDDYVSALSPLFRLTKENRAYLTEGMKFLLPYVKEVQLASLISKKTFIANVREEVGYNITLTENLNYKCSVLPKLFSGFRNRYLANKHGRCHGHPANQRMIANIAYANRLGNGDIESGDGWTNRGQGGIMLTGAVNFQANREWVDKNIPTLSEAFKNNDVYTDKQTWLLAASIFWARNNIGNLVAKEDNFRTIADIATAKINKHTDSYGKRYNHLMKLMS